MSGAKDGERQHDDGSQRLVEANRMLMDPRSLLWLLLTSPKSELL
jgi:hypothetical protein